MTDHYRFPEETAEPYPGPVRALLTSEIEIAAQWADEFRHFHEEERAKEHDDDAAAFRQHLAALDRLADPALGEAIERLKTQVKEQGGGGCMVLWHPQLLALRHVLKTITALRSPAHE